MDKTDELIIQILNNLVLGIPIIYRHLKISEKELEELLTSMKKERLITFTLYSNSDFPLYEGTPDNIKITKYGREILKIYHDTKK